MRRSDAIRICLVLALAAAAGACAARGQGARPRNGQLTCRNDEAGFDVTYPAAWYTEACRQFDPAPLDESVVDRDAAIAFETRRMQLEAFVRELSGPAQDLIERRRVEVAGRPALRLRLRATRDSRLVPPGTLTTQYVVDLRGSVLVARAAGRPGSTFGAAEDVLDRMIFSLKLDQASSSRMP